MENKGQDLNIWTNEWVKTTPENEIQMWDYFGGRQWITKYVPRFGKVLEAGCGLGRYVFYLSKFGIDIEGIDFSNDTIQVLNQWQKKYNFDCRFISGDVLNLPYENNSLSGYISLGVIEHFIEGPQKVLNESYRVLRPGGIAIITTPNKSFLIRYRNPKKAIKNVVKKIIRYKSIKTEFFQYEYTSKQLKNFLSQAGFYLSRVGNCDLLYPFVEIGNFTYKNITPNSFAVKISNLLENSISNKLGGQSISIGVKVADIMHCFICGELKCERESLVHFDVPVCKDCSHKKISEWYKKNTKVKFSTRVNISPPYLGNLKNICEISGEEFKTDELFEDYGFTKKIKPDLLKDISINIELSCNHLKYIWRKRSRFGKR